MQVPNSRVLRVVFVAVAVLLLGSCKDSGGGSGGDSCGGGECKLTASDASFGEAFGFAVAISGDEVLVGSSLNVENGPSSGAAYVFRRDGSRFEQIQKLLASDGEPGDRFGSSVSIDGDVLVVGARTADDGMGAAVGSAYVFRLIDDEWTEEAEIFADDGEDGDSFGRSVSISDDVIVVGAPRDNDGGVKSGSAYVFRYNGVDTWVQEDKIVASDPTAGDFYGTAVAVDGDVIAVGSPEEDDSGRDSGAVYAYGYNGVDWDEDQKIKAFREPLACESPTVKDDSYPDDAFGISVAVDGDRILIGADGREIRRQPAACQLNIITNGTGGAYVYQETAPGSGAWILEFLFEPTDFAPAQLFGRSVSISGDVVVAGSRADSDAASFGGSAYVFRFDGLDWAQDQKITASDAEPSDWLGESIAVDGETTIVGAFGDDDNGPQAGAAYVFGL